MGSLKSFIKAVRKAKTIADERSVVKKESAAIRTSFKDINLDQTTRRVNIAKLLYLYIIGEKTHFGQVECIKLLASSKFADKRLGYLATMLILDENQEVLTLLTNSLDNDMQHPNHYIIGLALCCLGNIASPELARDLYPNVERLFDSNSAYIKKKATIVASKLIEKNDELAEFFAPKVSPLINEKLSGVLLGTLKLTQTIYLLNDANFNDSLVRLTPRLIGHLKRLTTSGYSPDYDVLGINDPFLQTELIKTLRFFSNHSSFNNTYLENLNDILTQICSNIEIGKNVGHSILYECIKTIFYINSDQSLKILGINLLGKFLSTKDNNTRYVALNTLLTVINFEPNAVQRHRAIIVSCLTDGDISIRRRALELSFAILNDSNIRVISKEIINYLTVTNDNDLKPYIISQLILLIEKYSPNDNWKFDNLIRILANSGNFIQLEYISNMLGLIIKLSNPNLKKSILLKLVKLLFENLNQFGLSLVTFWCIGEYFELINNEPIEINNSGTVVNEFKVLELFSLVTNNSNYSHAEIIQLTNYLLTAIIKLSVKFTTNESLEKLRIMLDSKIYSLDLEIQIRAIEYSEIFSKNVNIKKGLLSKMPAPPLKQKEILSLQDQGKVNAGHNTSQNQHSASRTQTNGTQSNTQDLLDLTDDATEKPVKTDLLSDIFSNSPGPAPTQTQSQNSHRTNNDILDLFNTPSNSQVPSAVDPAASKSSQLPADIFGSASPAIPQANEILAFQNESITVNFIPKSIGSGQASIESRITTNTANAITDFQLLIAVPKSQKLTITTNNQPKLINRLDVIVQNIKITGNSGSKIKLRVKITYKVNGQLVERLFDFSKFDQTL